MGRKIPAKKHRGVKDPLEQQARRFQSIKGKINAPPKDPDEQPIPRSLTRLFAFQHKDTNRKKKKKEPTQPRSLTDVTSPSGVGSNPIAHLKKLPGESGRGFSLRINSAIRTLHDPTEQDYQQDLEAEDVKGERMAAQRARRQRKRRAAARARPAAPPGAPPGAPPAEPAPPRLSRGQKLALKKNAHKQKALEDARSEVVYERVSFGDVTHAPPALTAPRHAAAACGAPRPGRRDLLLSSLLAGGAAGGAGGAAARAGGAAGGADDAAERRRLAAVAAYRQLKKQRQLEHNNRKKIK